MYVFHSNWLKKNLVGLPTIFANYLKQILYLCIMKKYKNRISKDTKCIFIEHNNHKSLITGAKNIMNFRKTQNVYVYVFQYTISIGIIVLKLGIILFKNKVKTGNILFCGNVDEYICKYNEN